VVLWALWTERNEVVFNNKVWRPNKLLHKIWSDIIDYGRVEWPRTQAQVKKWSRRRRNLAINFANRWSRNGVFAHAANMQEDFTEFQPRWVLTGPMAGFLFQVH
jgi:hypothetical protein